MAVYIGNPAAHNLATLLYGRVLIKALGTKNIYSASTVDQMPKQISAGLMFGTILSVPVPDVDRTDHLMILGANPLQSNGSLLTAPDMRGRIRRIRERGGRVVVIDPRRTRTAEHADDHHFIRPRTDALLLFGLVHTIFEAIEQIHSQGTPVLLVEQNANAALKHSNRAYVLETGAVSLQGASAEVAANPKVKEAYLGE